MHTHTLPPTAVALGGPFICPCVSLKAMDVASPPPLLPTFIVTACAVCVVVVFRAELLRAFVLTARILYHQIIYYTMRRPMGPPNEGMWMDWKGRVYAREYPYWSLSGLMGTE